MRLILASTSPRRQELLTLLGLPFDVVALAGSGTESCEVQVAEVSVTMKPLNEEALAAYLRTEDSLGKAGAYSIQGGGAELIERIEGDYTAAVGLPLRIVAEMLSRRGMACPIDINQLYARKPYPNWARFNS